MPGSITDMNGQSDLGIMLAQLAPLLNEGEYVFTSVESYSHGLAKNAISSFREEEGVTLIVRKQAADEYHLQYDLVCSWITLTVHSSLQAVGLTAAFASALSKEGISCNVIAAFYHDHIFVAASDSARAMYILQSFAKKP
jgi:hypothetical protein